jgi:hypothetical protein
MNKGTLIFIIVVFFLTACAQTPEAPDTTTDQSQPPSQPVAPGGDDVAPAVTSGPDCLGPEVHPMGEEIADQFDETTYEEVMTWFCNGAEFEDVLVALQTEKDTGEPADDLLKLLAEGQTWEQIWDALGLTD